MQPTLPPGWSELERFRRRRGRVTLAELSEITARAHQMHMQELRRLRELHARLDWPRAHPPEILLYTPNQLRQLIRLGNAAEAAAAQPTGSSWRPGPLGAPWHLPDGDITLRQPHQPEDPAGAGGGGEWWWWRGWGAGALLLLAALLLVRAADRCFTRNYARSRRRRSEEWPTPNVLATSNRLPLSVDAETSPNEFDIYPSESEASNDMIYNADLPPPYSECADGNKHIHREEPPPPYSACYVAFSNPKDGVPSVTFLNSQRRNMFEDSNEPTSTRFINVQTSTEELTQIAHSSNGFNLDTGQIANNPIGDRIYKLPYFDNTALETDDSDCNVECITDSIECITNSIECVTNSIECVTNSIECVTDSAECINIGPAPIASPDMAIDVSDVSSSGERNETVSC